MFLTHATTFSLTFLLRCVTLVLMTLACSSPALCGEIHDAARAGDVKRVEALLKEHPELVFSKEAGNGANHDEFISNDWTPLHVATWAGQKDVVAVLLAHKADIDARDSVGETPLYRAVLSKHTDIVALLLDNHADANLKGHDGIGAWSPLQEAVWANNASMATLLLEHNADINARRNNGETALYMVAEAGLSDMVSLLLAQHTDINAENNDGYTPFVVALVLDRKNVAELLLAGGADVNLKTSNGKTPLHAAAGAGDIKMVEALLARHVDVNISTKLGTPLHAAANSGHTDMVELLLAHHADINARDDAGHTPLHAATSLYANCGWGNHVYPDGSRNCTQAARALIDHHANVDVKDNAGQTPLFGAVARGDKDMVTLLLAHKTNVNARDNDARGPLVAAVFESAATSYDHREVAKLLLDSGADVNEGHVLLSNAVRNKDKSMVKLLLDYHADVNGKNPFGETPLDIATGDNVIDLALVNMLLAHHANVNAQNKYGNTMLHAAVWTRNKGLVKLLLANGADVNALNKPEAGSLCKAMPPLQAWLGHPQGQFDTEILNLLLDNGAGINALDCDGRAPLHIAAKAGNAPMLMSLLAHKADINVKDTYHGGWTPLHYTAYGLKPNFQVMDGGDVPMSAAELEVLKNSAALLLAHHARVNEKDKEGRTSLDWALHTDNKPVAELLRQHGGESTGTGKWADRRAFK
jgi:ankyrin repeat protein